MVVKKDVDGTWYARVSYKDLSTGKYNKKSKFNFKRKKDAEAWESKIKSQVESGLDIGQNPVFTEYFKEWVSAYKSVPNVSRRTYDNYITTQNIVEEYFKGIKIKQITHLSYQEFLNYLAQKNAKSTNQKINKHIRASVKSAIGSGIPIINFTEGCSVSGKAGQAEEDKYLSEEDIKKVMSELKTGLTDDMTTRWMAILQFAGGLRYSEVAGLTFEDFDFKNNRLRINKAWSFKEDKHVPTKNKINRTIKIEPSVSKEFQSYVIRIKAQRLKNRLSTDLIFTSYTGFPPTHAAINKTLKNACKRANTKPITSHALRHTHVSLLLYHGMDIISISKRIGHGSPKTTMEEYSHIINELEYRNDKISDAMVADVL